MKKARKLICLLVVTVFALSFVLVGCGGSTAEKSTTTAGTTALAETTATETTAELKPVELSWYMFSDPPKDLDLVMTELNKYLKEKINATVKATFLGWDDYNAKVPLMISSGQPFDICFSCPWLINTVEYVGKDAFMPLDDLVNTYGKEMKAAIPQMLWDGCMINGKLYSLPVYKEVGYQYGLFYNKNIATELGIDFSGMQGKGLFALESVIKTIKEKKPGVLPFSGGVGMYRSNFPEEHVSGDWDLPGVVNVPGEESYKRSDDKVFNQYETPEFASFCDKAYEWFKAGLIPSDPNYNGDNDWKAGKVFSSSPYYGPGSEGASEAATGIPTGYVPFYDAVVETSGGIFAFSKNSQNPERAMMFMNLMYTDIYVGNMIRHGIEGVHYTRKGDQCDMGGVAGIDKTAHPYNFKEGWMFGNIFNQYWVTDSPSNIAQIYLDFNATAKVAANNGFVFNTKPVEGEVAAIRNVLNEFATPLKSGIVDPKVYLPKFIDKLKANGADKLIAEIQTQLDSWKATK